MPFFLVYLLYSLSQKNKLTFAAFNTLDVFNLLYCLIDTDMAQNEPQRKETPSGPSPNSPSLLFEYQCRSGKFIRLANRIETFLSELECSSRYSLSLVHSTWTELNWTELVDPVTRSVNWSCAQFSARHVDLLRIDLIGCRQRTRSRTPVRAM